MYFHRNKTSRSICHQQNTGKTQYKNVYTLEIVHTQNRVKKTENNKNSIISSHDNIIFVTRPDHFTLKQELHGIEAIVHFVWR